MFFGHPYGTKWCRLSRDPFLESVRGTRGTLVGVFRETLTLTCEIVCSGPRIGDRGARRCNLCLLAPDVFLEEMLKFLLAITLATVLGGYGRRDDRSVADRLDEALPSAGGREGRSMRDRHTAGRPNDSTVLESR
jgi:hypothetical protein